MIYDPAFSYPFSNGQMQKCGNCGTEFLNGTFHSCPVVDCPRCRRGEPCSENDKLLNQKISRLEAALAEVKEAIASAPCFCNSAVGQICKSCRAIAKINVILNPDPARMEDTKNE